MGISEEKIQDKLAQKFSLSEKEIEEFMEKYWKRGNRLMPISTNFKEK